jgi:hypothetical protein
MHILITPYKFTEFSYINYELDLFEKKFKDNFEIHDLSKIVNPTWVDSFKVKKHKKSKIFNSIKQWEYHIKKIKKINKEVIIHNELDANNFNSIILQFKLSKLVKKIIRRPSPGIPNPYHETKNKMSFVMLIKKIIKKKNNLRSLFFSLKVKILNMLLSFIIFNEIYILYAGKKNTFRVNLKAKKFFFVNYHIPDYSRLISIQKKINPQKPTAVYIDTPGPYFKDDMDLFEQGIKYNKTQWYCDLNNFLLNLEKIYMCKVVIVPHPKVKRLKNPYYDKKFKICHDLDAVHTLIPQSSFVITINASTAINLAIACKKKIMFIYNNQQKKYNNSLFKEMEFIAKKCKSSFININNYNSNILLKPIDIKTYENYLYRYVTSKNISKRKNYEIINNILKPV